MMTLRALAVPAALAIALAPIGSARADEKEDCINAAEASQKLRKESKLSEAREKVLACSREVCPAVVRSDCVKWLSEIDASLPTVVFRVRDEAGHDVIDVKISVDGKEVLSKLTGSAIPIDPGQHKLRYESAGHLAAEDTVLIAENEKGRVLKMDLHDASAATPSTGSGGGATTTTAATGDGQKTAPSGGAGPGPWVLGGVGVASLAAFAVLEAIAQGEYGDLKNGCGATRSCTDSQTSPTQTKFIVAGITMGVGIAALAVAVPWLILGGKSKGDPKAAWLTVAPTLAGGAVGVLGGRF